ncbi:hypothetical protein LTR05_006342 [Lithohypha guttulata]|uniref:Uncharacterized protein n=1 Tax=Lithohypha guttulata TaxID=1690604 RepID=A0AAN7Y579_9EURO|nr:hypothetical protein LTR05_006342 [Lithohypha guttulata]
MANTTLLKHLASPNPSLDCTRCTTGANTVNARWDDVTSLEDWKDFNYETLMKSYGQVLQQPIPPVPEITPPLSTLEKQISTENTFEDVLIRTTMLEVSTALRIAWPLCYSTDVAQDIAEIGRGAKARRGTAEEDDRYYPDWAGIRQNQVTDFGYKNLCPGETKLASKWGTSDADQERTDHILPFRQIQTYCGRQWGSRYGYIITPAELVVVRISKELIGPGLAVLRSVRDMSQQARTQRAHERTFSEGTISSGMNAMSLDTGSSYNDDANPNIEYGPLLYKSIPWSAEGDDVLTVKLALWWLHMETKHDLSIQHSYPSFQSKSSQIKPPPSIGDSEASQQPGVIHNPRPTQYQRKGGKKTL